MSEYLHVERPFLDRLRQLGWEVIEQGRGIPQDPAKSLRTSFREVTLKAVFQQAVRDLNRHEGQPWLTDKQLDDLHDLLTAAERGGASLLEANQEVFRRLIGETKTTVAQNELTGESDVLVQLIDFDHWENNRFHAINQFRVTTAGA